MADRSATNTRSGDNFAEYFVPDLSQDEYTLSLIATGLVQLHDRIVNGQPFAYPYPVPLQRGLDNLTVLRLSRDQSPPQSIPDLIAWAHRPLEQWRLQLAEDAVGPHDCLLIDQVPTNTCESWACANGDVEAELSERQFIKSLFELCQSTVGGEGYTAFRKVLVQTPVLTAIEFQEIQIKPEFEPLGNHIRAAYSPAPTSCSIGGRFYCCEHCGNLLVRSAGDKLACENERCRILGAKPGREISAQEQPYWLKRGLRRFITAPGLTEVQLAEKIEALGAKVELWPMYDRYDLRIGFPDGIIWAVDVKDWANPFLLARQVKPIPRTPTWNRAFFVFPDERRLQRNDYMRAFRNNCTVLDHHTQALFARQLLRKVEAHMEKTD